MALEGGQAINLLQQVQRQHDEWGQRHPHQQQELHVPTTLSPPPTTLSPPLTPSGSPQTPPPVAPWSKKYTAFSTAESPAPMMGGVNVDEKYPGIPKVLAIDDEEDGRRTRSGSTSSNSTGIMTGLGLAAEMQKQQQRRQHPTRQHPRERGSLFDESLNTSLSGSTHRLTRNQRRNSQLLLPPASGAPKMSVVITQRDGKKFMGATDFLHRLDPPTPVPEKREQRRARFKPGAGGGLSGPNTPKHPEIELIFEQSGESLGALTRSWTGDEGGGGWLGASLSHGEASWAMSPLGMEGTPPPSSVSTTSGQRPFRSPEDGISPPGGAVAGGARNAASLLKSGDDPSSTVVQQQQQGPVHRPGANEITGKYLAAMIYTKEMRRKKETETLFGLLAAHQRTAHFDKPVSDSEQIARFHAKRGHICVDSVFKPVCRLLESLWNHFRVGREERRRISERLFDEPSQEHYNEVFAEVKKYMSRVVQSEDILKLVNLRETIIATLMQRARSPQLLEGVKQAVQENIVVEIFNQVLLLRHTTCRIVDEVYKLRLADGRIKPLLWEGLNYLIKMQEDLGPLSDTYLPVLIPNLVYSGNPMLLPPKYFAGGESPTPGGGGGGVSNRESSLSSTTMGGRASTSLSMRSTSVEPSSRTRAATPGGPPTPQHKKKSPSPGGGNSRAQTPSNRSLQNTMSASTTGAGGESGGLHSLTIDPAKLKPTANIVHARDGEEIRTVSVLTKRQQYFKQREKEAYIASRKIVMDRSNVYQYPAEVYLPKAQPVWQITGKRLLTSLDPSTVSNPYLDKIDYQKMHFGRLSTPPEFTNAHTFDNYLVDEVTKGYRPTAPVPSYNFEDLHQRELLIFGENAAMKKATAQEKLRRGIMKLRIAQKGFFALLKKQRTDNAERMMIGFATGTFDPQKRRASSHIQPMPTKEQLAELEQKKRRARGAAQFLTWVQKHAPDWVPTVGGQLEELVETAQNVNPLNIPTKRRPSLGRGAEPVSPSTTPRLSPLPLSVGGGGGGGSISATNATATLLQQLEEEAGSSSDEDNAVDERWII